MEDYGQITKRTIDGSFVITKDGMPYHVPNEGIYVQQWREIDAYAQAHPDKVTIESPHVPTEEEKNAKIQTQLTEAVQTVLDAEAQKLNYDNCLSVCSYVDTGVAKFDAEGKAFREWRSAVWAKGYEILDAVLAGEREIPAEEELIAELPKLVIDYGE